MKSELLERLYLEIRTKDTGNVNENQKSTTVLPKVCWLYQMYILLSLSDENVPPLFIVNLICVVQKQ